MMQYMVAVSYTHLDVYKRQDKERQAFDEEFSMQKEEKKVNHNEEILALHDKGYSRCV